MSMPAPPNEQHGEKRAGYGEELIDHPLRNLNAQFGRGFGSSNIFQMRAFYLANCALEIPSA
jgi:hypothetical protein